MIGALVPVLGTVIQEAFDRLIPDKAEAARAAQELQVKIMEISAQQNAGQVDINKIEAGSDNLFKSGWRPFIGWVCGFALLYTFIGQPIAIWACRIWWPEITPPDIVSDNLFELVLAMLGLGGLRTYEKVKR